jgi:hypothetical protein
VIRTGSACIADGFQDSEAVSRRDCKGSYDHNCVLVAKNNVPNISKRQICAELPAIYTGITLTDYHNAMADMIKQIRPPTSSPTRQRRDALSSPKQKAKRKKGRKKKSAKEVSGDEGVNLPSAGDGVRVRPSTAKPVAQKDGREIRRVKSANNNVHASSWVMSTEDENALDDDDDDDNDDVEQDIELDEARCVCAHNALSVPFRIIISNVVKNFN